MADPGKAILCIDDDPDILEFFETVLTAQGYEVVTAPTAEEGLRTFKAQSPALVFVDLMMEEVDAGTNFVKELKALGSDVPVYMVSSVGDALNLSTSYADLGLSGVLQKPVSIDNLLKLVERALAG